MKMAPAGLTSVLGEGNRTERRVREAEGFGMGTWKDGVAIPWIGR